MLCDSHLSIRCAFVAEREREGEESLFLSNARMRDENRCISFFFIAKNEKFGREKDTNADVVLNRFSDENGILLRETIVLDVTERVIAFYSRRDGEFARRFRRDFESLGFSLF